MELLRLVLAVWCLTYHLSLGGLFLRLREVLGVGFDYDAQGNATDRWGTDTISDILNCPPCTAIVMGLVVWALQTTILVDLLALGGGGALLARWWMSQRPKVEWWL